METGRFAPSTTGDAHPGTLMAALLCWLDARSRGDRIVLRLEDLDPGRSLERHSESMLRDLEWFGLDWDEVCSQRAARPRHEDALDRLGGAGLLYPCSCSRAEVRARGAVAPDGSRVYPGTCRERALPGGDWRSSDEPLRVRLPDADVMPVEESALDLRQNPMREMGDPVVRRRDGAIAYHLASVVDDFDLSVTRVVRGRDLAASTATQVALQRLLGVRSPVYRHHLLLLEERGGKLAKLHGSVGAAALRGTYSAEALCGALACACGLVSAPAEISPAELVDAFAWSRVGDVDRVLRWTGTRLELVG